MVNRTATLGVTKGGLRSASGRIGLPVWFICIDLLAPTFDLRALAVDARLYQMATNICLTGGDPWSLSAYGLPYAAAPWSLLAYAPTAFVSVDIAASMWMAAGILATLWTLRRLGLPLWWLAFPPLTQALWNGNAQPIVLAALLVRSPVGVTLAGGLKLYGLLPAVVARRWRDLAIAAVLLVVALVALPWGLYVENRFALDTVSNQTWNGSAWRFSPLIPFAVVALWVLRRRGAEWFAIPSLWPGTQHFYHVFALPALRDKPWLAAALAFPLPLLAPVAVIGYAIYSWRALTSEPVKPGETPTSVDY